MKPVKKFMRKLFIFSLPLVIIYVCLFFPVILSGEHLSSQQVAQLQQIDNKTILYGPIPESPYWFFKAEASRIAQPNVLLAGDSRALQVRNFFFNDDVKVYNAGFSATNTADIQYFLESQDVTDIDIVIFPLDQVSFNVNRADVSYPSHTIYTQLPQDFDTRIRAQIPYILKNYKSIKTLWTQNMSERQFIGLNAVLNQNGMLNDGSYFYGEVFKKEAAGQTSQERTETTLDRIKTADRRFEHGEHANPNAIFYLEQLLQYCKEKNIYVIAYAPPYAPTVNNAMRDKGDAYGYQYEMLEIVPPIFDSYGFEFFDYTDAAFLGCTDEYYIDGFHGSDVVFLRMFIDMIEKGSRLGGYCSLEDLKKYDSERFSDIRLLETLEQYNALILKN